MRVWPMARASEARASVQMGERCVHEVYVVLVACTITLAGRPCRRHGQLDVADDESVVPIRGVCASSLCLQRGTSYAFTGSVLGAPPRGDCR